jgi:PAS domain S-box-containing protein
MLDDLQHVVEHLPVAVYVCEAPGGAIRLYNRRAAELWGRAPELGGPAERFCGSLRLFRPDGRPLAPADTPMAEALRSGQVHEQEVVIERPDGSRVRVQVSIAPLRDRDGRLVGTVNAFQDVTERKAAEDAAAHLAAVVAGAEDAIVSKTLEGIVTSWNRAAEQMFDYSSAEMIGQPIARVIPPDRLGEEAEILSRVGRGETLATFETERVARDGHRLLVSLTVSPITEPGGRIIGASKIARDITERRRAEGELRRTVQRLEALYRLADRVGRAKDPADVCDAAVEAIMAGGADRASVLVFDDDGVMRFRAWRNLSDAYRAAADGHSPWTPAARDAAPITAEDVLADPALASLRDVIAGEGIRALAFVPLVDQGRLLGTFTVYHDTPHRFSADELRLATTIAHKVAFGLARVETEATLRDLLLREQAARREADAARAEAERASRAKDEFLAMLAHELRNPLGVIVNAIAVINGNAHLPADLRRPGTMVRRQAEHLARLLDDLLDVARITSGRIELDRDPVDLRAAIDLAVEAHRHRLEAKRQRLAVVVPERAVTVTGDAVRLQQVVGNLLDNAVRYTPAGGAIAIALTTEAGEARLQIRDDGAGIPPESLVSVFELFAQANPTLARTEGGLGIGLTLVKRVVELHGGSIRAQSEGSGRGAEFVIRLPLAAEPAAGPSERACPPVLHPRRVLVIEDHPDGREMLALALRLQGHEVFEAATASAGLEAAGRHTPDVVLVDIGLPDRDGYEVGRQLREKLGDGLRLIAVTGYGQPRDRARSSEVGFDAHLVKPVDPARLAEVLQEPS